MKDLCRICGSDNLSAVLYGQTELINCHSCGIHYLANFDNQSKIDNYYKNDYKITSADIVDTEYRHLFRLGEQIELAAEVMKYKSPTAKLLDIGCDKAFFIDEARRFGFDCTGIELSEEAIKYAAKLGIKISPEIDTASGKFDIVVMWHSLEHFPNPVNFLGGLKEHLNNEAVILIRVPSFDSFWSRLLKSRWIWFQPQNHFFHYSQSSLRTLLNISGFTVDKVEFRKANNRNSRNLFKVSNNIFRKHFNYHISFKQRLKRIYEDITGVELFAVARIKKD